MEDLSVDAMQFDNILPTIEFFFQNWSQSSQILMLLY